MDRVIAGLRQRLLKRLPGQVAGRLRGWRLGWILRRFRPYVTRRRFGPVWLQVWIGDPLARGWYDHDWAPVPEIETLRGQSLVPGSRVFDVGAHQGVVAMMLAREVGPTGQVVAVEPVARNAVAARRNRDLNALPAMEIVEAAVSDTDGTTVITAGLNAQLDRGRRRFGEVTVKAVTLDGLAQTYGTPDLVVLDVEGAECDALAGASGLLDGAADWCVEVHVGEGLEELGGSVDRLLAFFPPERFVRQVRREADSGFDTLDPDDPACRPSLQSRFFLLARRQRS